MHLLLSCDNKKIAKTLLGHILLFSGVVTICITSIQLYSEYNRDLENIEEQFDRIEEISAPSLAWALWEFNEDSLKIQLESIANSGDIAYVKITDEENRSIVAGEVLTHHPLIKQTPLTYQVHNKDIEVGNLTVVASKSRVYRRFYSRLTIILLSQAVKTFLVSTFIFLIVHHLVIQHLVFISSYLEKIKLKELPGELNLHRGAAEKKDELNQMVCSINEMIQRQYKSFYEVEQIVQDRTVELTDINDQLHKEIRTRKQTEEILNQFKFTLDQTVDCIFIFSPDTLKFLYTNQGAKKQTGYNEKEFLHMTPLDIKPEFTEENFQKMITPLLEGKEVLLTFETVHQHKNGNLIPVEIYLQFIQQSREDDGRFIAIVRDITERKKHEQERENLIDKLEKAVTEIKTLRGILPLCSYCKKIRDDSGSWEQVDVYIYKHSEADISHSICQDCMKKHHPEEYEALYSKKTGEP
ncbi:MAG: PAS domain S-box protein [Candidatus Electrothrix sp. ATG2]|nr:PAS domain S-box protein [Candidatus Electrothrix sp. ATG2]